MKKTIIMIMAVLFGFIAVQAQTNVEQSKKDVLAVINAEKSFDAEIEKIKVEMPQKTTTEIYRAVFENQKEYEAAVTAFNNMQNSRRIFYEKYKDQDLNLNPVCAVACLFKKIGCTQNCDRMFPSAENVVPHAICISDCNNSYNECIRLCINDDAISKPNK